MSYCKFWTSKESKCGEKAAWRTCQELDLCDFHFQNNLVGIKSLQKQLRQIDKGDDEKGAFEPFNESQVASVLKVLNVRAIR